MPHRITPAKLKIRRLTVGGFIREAEWASTANPCTFREYTQALRRIAAGALEIEPPKHGTVGSKRDAKTGKHLRKGKKAKLSPFDYPSPEMPEFRAKIDSTHLAKLTPARRSPAGRKSTVEAAVSESW